MFRGIALGGGGVRAGLQVGALKTLEATWGTLEVPDGYWGCSAGAVVATGLAFKLTAAQLEHLFHTRLQLSSVLPPLRLSSFADLSATKGLFPMDRYETELIETFKDYGIDLTTKRIEDAPLPLRIVATNLTTQSTTVFTGQVRILDALRCSACIPLVFHPQVLYNNLYVDGGVSVDCLDMIVPDDCLVLHISERPASLYPSHLAEMDLSSFLYTIYRTSRGRPLSPSVLWLRNSTVSVLQDLTPAEKESLIEEGASQTRAFLSKRLAKERKDVTNGTLPTVVREEGTGL